MPTCFSGGAIGADLAWGRAAKEAGFSVVHFSFPGHKTEADRAELKILSDNELRAYNSYLTKASQNLKRHWPPKHAYVRKLLQRNGWQVRLNTPVYAVGMLEDGQVAGGTAWAVQLAINLKEHGGPIYLYEQTQGVWLGWIDGEWKLATPPKPTGDFTGIGTRAINDLGLAAIKELFE